MLTLSAPRTLRGATRRTAQLELDEAAMERCATIFRDALAGGKRLTRAAMEDSPARLSTGCPGRVTLDDQVR